MQNELAKAVESARQGKPPTGVHLTFDSTPQIDTFLKEMEAVKAHPEWLT